MIRVLTAVAALLVWGQGAATPICPGEAAKHVGEKVAVQGRVTTVTVLDKDHTIYINFGEPYPHQTFTAVLYDSVAARFPDPKTLLGKTVVIHGTVRLRGKRPQIILSSPEQINVVV